MQKENNKLSFIFIIIVIKAPLNRLISKVFTAKACYNNILKKTNYFFAKIWFGLLFIFNAIFTKFLVLINPFFRKFGLLEALIEKPILNLFGTIALSAKNAF